MLSKVIMGNAFTEKLVSLSTVPTMMPSFTRLAFATAT